MIRVSSQAYSAIWGLIGLILGAGWVAYGMLGNGNTVFLTIMVILSMLLAAGTAIVLRRRVPG